jgi:hypothetical protein
VNDWPKEKGTYIPISSSAPADCPNCARLQAVAEAAQRYTAARRAAQARCNAVTEAGGKHEDDAEWDHLDTVLSCEEDDLVAAVDALGGAPPEEKPVLTCAAAHEYEVVALKDGTGDKFRRCRRCGYLVGVGQPRREEPR